MMKLLISIIFTLAIAGCRDNSPSPQVRQTASEDERRSWPKTIDEAVTKILATMDEESKERVRKTKKDDLILLLHGWGTGIRNEFGLRRGNRELMSACQTNDPEAASMVIIEAVWQKLQKKR